MTQRVMASQCDGREIGDIGTRKFLRVHTMQHQRRTHRLATILVGIALIASACGGGSSGSSDSSGSGASDASGASGDGDGEAAGSDLACDVLSNDFIESLFNENVEPKDGLADELGASATSECQYVATADDAADTDFYFVSVAMYPSGGLADFVDYLEVTDQEVVRVLGPGDEAVQDPLGVGVSALWVRSGDTDFKVVLRTSESSEVSDAQVLNWLRMTATEVLANI